MIGEIGGNAEERGRRVHQGEHEEAGRGFIAGTTAPPGKRMGHAGAIISGGKGTAEDEDRGAQGRGREDRADARPTWAPRSSRLL